MNNDLNNTYDNVNVSNKQTEIQHKYKLTKQFFNNNKHIISIPADKGNINIVCLSETFTNLRNNFITDNIKNGTFKPTTENFKGPFITYLLSKLISHMGEDLINNKNNTDNLHQHNTHQIDSIQSQPHIQNKYLQQTIAQPQDRSHQTPKSQQGPLIKMDTLTKMWIPIINPLHLQALHSININLTYTDLLFRPSILTGLIKIHKNPIKFRPVIDTTNTIAKPLNQWALNILKHINTTNFKYSVINSTQAINIINISYPNQTIPKNYCVRSLDFESMYTNVPIEDALLTLFKDYNHRKT